MVAGQPQLTWADLAGTGPLQARVRLADGSVQRAADWRRHNSTLTTRCGPLDIEWRADDRIWMTGPVELEHEGVLDALATA